MAEQTDSHVLVTRGLTKVFRDFWLRKKVTAVAGLNLEIRPHEVFGLLGPNGSGKSTTIKMILGLLFPTAGWISVFGRQPSDVMTKHRLGFLPEESFLYPFLNARETLDYYGRLFHQPRRERMRRIDMLLEMVGLSGAAYRRVGEYSKGMARRIGLAQALINDPDLLILDEPTSGMDPIGTNQFKELIRALAARGKTVLLSSHLLADVEDVCDRVCILYGGQQRACGEVSDLLADRGKTQILTEQLDAATLRRVREVLADAGYAEADVSVPRDKLESLFLRIVAEAQQQRVVTGGAVAGGAVAEFLRGEGDQPDREDLIEQLVAAAGPEQGAAEAQPEGSRAEQQAPAAGAPVDREQIDRLVAADTGAAERPDQAEGMPGPAAPAGRPGDARRTAQGLPASPTPAQGEPASAAGEQAPPTAPDEPAKPAEPKPDRSADQADRGIIDDLIQRDDQGAG